MSKLTYEDKINMYSDKKNGMSIIQIFNKYNRTVFNERNVLLFMCFNKRNRSILWFKIPKKNTKM